MMVKTEEWQSAPCCLYSANYVTIHKRASRMHVQTLNFKLNTKCNVCTMNYYIGILCMSNERASETNNEQANEYTYIWNYFILIFSSVNDIVSMLLIESSLYFMLYAESLLIAHVYAYAARTEGYKNQKINGFCIHKRSILPLYCNC